MKFSMPSVPLYATTMFSAPMPDQDPYPMWPNGPLYMWVDEVPGRPSRWCITVALLKPDKTDTYYPLPSSEDSDRIERVVYRSPDITNVRPLWERLELIIKKLCRMPLTMQAYDATGEGLYTLFTQLWVEENHKEGALDDAANE